MIFNLIESFHIIAKMWECRLSEREREDGIKLISTGGSQHLYWLWLKMNDKRFDKRLSLKKHGSNEADDENEERGEKSWQVWVTINQSISEGPIYSNFTPECSASLPQHRHRQSINQTGGRGRIYNLVYKAYSAFLHTVQIGGFSACQPTSLGILRWNRGDWRLWRKFGRANKIWPQTHHFGSPFAIIQLLTKVLHRRVFWYHWLLRIYGFVFYVELCGRRFGSNRRLHYIWALLAYWRKICFVLNHRTNWAAS